MKVSEQIEPLVREALAAAVAQETDRFTVALDSMARTGDGPFVEALDLAVNICSVTLFTIHHGQRPVDDQLTYLADAFAESEAWAELSARDALDFLTALADRKPVTDSLPLDIILPIAFVMGGWLLSGFLPANKHWYNFLDEILTAIEAMPERS